MTVRVKSEQPLSAGSLIHEGVCRFCGLGVADHTIKEEGFGSWAKKLVGADGHLYEALHFPRRGVPFVPQFDIAEETAMIMKRLAEVNTDRADLNDMIELYAQGKTLVEAFYQFDIPVPEVVTGAMATLERVIKRKRDDGIEARLRELESADAADQTASERRANRATERAKLLVKLGKADG